MTDAYQQALDYLYSYIDFSLTHQENLASENFDLARMHALLAHMGDPHKAYPSVHIAGSKGKGSVSALCAGALQAQGYKVGLYTSPHLKEYTERMQINRREIEQDKFVKLVEAIKTHVDKVPGVTTFEIGTALAFWFFAQENVDIAVLEVGLGGRLDATNVVTPLVSVITQLYLEHTAILGDTIELIAAEKGGIIKGGIPLVLAPQVDAARQVVAEIVEERGASLIDVGEAYYCDTLSTSLDGQHFQVQAEEGPAQELSITLLGEHQMTNAVTAYAALQALDEKGFEVSQAAIVEGFAGTRWDGRFEVVRRQPPVIIDAAHVPDAARALRTTLDQFFPDLPVILVIGVSADKEVAAMLNELAPRVHQVITTQSTHPRAKPAEDLAEIVADAGLPVQAISGVGEALAHAVKEAGEDAIVLITGSIFTAASARIAWYEQHPAD
ncbi:MAG: bifunctional folylpolyglutamate synthase/dihydrofolate synthase [Chloroflexi bacterium]|nr:MAG: bifunctional folylpolyglutamate synthase/dihydrofolate synthase [Chloroflexota bacterium]MBL1197310.1 bifunctional folylpolyglutamate synthase/dihydrofolate synthase [Chloroflexota bacterium]NOH14606.1 bifunctional folylpolyglutamate synthase/dihydrofolate synthase [Chloroflexota bacterium]